MENETLVHQCRLPIGADEYEILVFSRPDGSHIAKTVIDVDDVIINNGMSLNEALEKHRQVLPLAINSRHLFAEGRRRD
ncbi:MAG: hypothetical protein C0615_07170 [Desulfuromonas sp.]|nr:MAG: hypothetical protein C0615_07170 [Desulfuromonas sp.]